MGDASPASPLIVGASGGSGTRVLVNIAEHGGFFMGAADDLHESSRDTILLRAVLGTWAPQFLTGWLAGDPDNEPDGMLEIYEIRTKRHRKGAPDAAMPWGWKHPRSILILPFLHRQEPGLRFVHLIRDGRDMAFSPNKAMLRRLEHIVLSPDELAIEDRGLRNLIFWGRINTLAADYGESQMAGKYLRVTYEDLCAQPRATVERLFAFIAADPAGVDAAASEIRPSESIGRWRNRERMLPRMLELGGAALERFGYTD